MVIAPSGACIKPAGGGGMGANGIPIVGGFGGGGGQGGGGGATTTGGGSGGDVGAVVEGEEDEYSDTEESEK